MENQSHLILLDMEALKPYGIIGGADVREEECTECKNVRFEIPKTLKKCIQLL